jgi:hypothetical protein
LVVETRRTWLDRARANDQSTYVTAQSRFLRVGGGEKLNVVENFMGQGRMAIATLEFKPMI